MRALLRTAITGPILIATAGAAVAESTALLLETIPVPAPLYLGTLTLSACSCFAHLAACVRVLITDHIDDVTRRIEDIRDDVQGRLDDYEANGLNTLIARSARERRHVHTRRRPPVSGANVHHLH